MDCRQKINIKDCPCTYTKCSRKGFCCLCLEHHRKNDELPACYFSAKAEKTYDRSIEKFIEDQKS